MYVSILCIDKKKKGKKKKEKQMLKKTTSFIIYLNINFKLNRTFKVSINNVRRHFCDIEIKKLYILLFSEF